MENVLSDLKEPKNVKTTLLVLAAELGKKDEINWNSSVIWAGNKLQQYLWENWRSSLLERGFTWPKFLKMMKFRTDDAILWLYNKITWDEFTERVIQSIDGPLGKAIIRR